MNITRRYLGSIAGGSVLFVALPAGKLLAEIPPDEMLGNYVDVAHPDLTIDSQDENKVHIHGSSKVHDKGPTTTQYLSDGFQNINFDIPLPKIKGVVNPKVPNPLFPMNGKMAVLIDYKGNWEFSGGFPGQHMPTACATAMGIGIKSSIGQVIAFVAHGTVPAEGEAWEFSKQGHAQVVADLWKDVVKGHKFHGAWSTQQIPPPPAPQQVSDKGDNGSGGGSAGEVLGIIGSVLGTILAFF